MHPNSDVNIKDDGDGNTALIVASQEGSDEIVLTLLNFTKVEDMNAVNDDDGANAIMIESGNKK